MKKHSLEHKLDCIERAVKAVEDLTAQIIKSIEDTGNYEYNEASQHYPAQYLYEVKMKQNGVEKKVTVFGAVREHLMCCDDITREYAHHSDGGYHYIDRYMPYGVEKDRDNPELALCFCLEDSEKLIKKALRPFLSEKRKEVKEFNENRKTSSLNDILKSSIDTKLFSSNPDLHLCQEALEDCSEYIDWPTFVTSRVLDLKTLEYIIEKGRMGEKYLFHTIECSKYRVENDIIEKYKDNFTFQYMSANRAKKVSNEFFAEMKMKGIV